MKGRKAAKAFTTGFFCVVNFLGLFRGIRSHKV
uniref:Uncharacterized protein n=1 Tax=Arundo donax TaxID=35708 RepID=A0A0A9AP04_ARUDO